MEQVQQFHEYLLRQRTYIRNHKQTLQGMRKCWKLVPRTAPTALSRDEYEGMYSTLLYEMTVCWDEEANDAVLAKMWQRDASSFSELDYNRFCCSIFFFVEMWVPEITQEAYNHIFSIIHALLSGQEFSSLPSLTDSSDQSFKPTLESFNDALDHERDLESINLNIGKSILFDAKKYFQLFGSPTATIQATNLNFFQLQEDSARTSSLRSDIREAYNRRYGGTSSKSTKSGCSNPKLLRPASSRQQSQLTIQNTTHISPPRPSKPLPMVILTGTTVLRSPPKPALLS